MAKVIFQLATYQDTTNANFGTRLNSLVIADARLTFRKVIFATSSAKTCMYFNTYTIDYD